MIEDFAFHSGYADVNGTKLYYEIAGSGYPLILIHAGIADCRMWDVQFRAFAQDHLVVRYDQRGFGRSKMVPGEYSNHDDLAGLLDLLGIESASLLGLSMGGSTALDFTLTYPDQVDALIVAAAAIGGHEWSNLALQKWGEIDDALEEGDKDRAIELDLQMWVDGPTRKANAVESEVREKVRVMNAPLYDAPQIAATERRLDPPAAQRLNEIDVPTLVLVGDSDMPDMMTIADKLEAAIKGARKIVIGGAAHMINMEQPQKFNRAVSEFLATL